MKEHKPIKRDKAFVELSRDHHAGLLLVWRIRKDQGIDMDSKLISGYVLEFFRGHLQEHFKEEEDFVFSKLPVGDGLRVQAEKEHEVIYELVDAIRENPSGKDLLKKFADLLEAHIRFEERVLFNHLQDSLTPEELEGIFERLKR